MAAILSRGRVKPSICCLQLSAIFADIDIQVQPADPEATLATPWQPQCVWHMLPKDSIYLYTLLTGKISIFLVTMRSERSPVGRRTPEQTWWLVADDNFNCMVLNFYICKYVWWHRSGSTLALVWPFAWQHQVIIWTNIDFSSVRFCTIHLNAISKWVTKLIFCIMSSKIILLKLLSHLPEANELNYLTPDIPLVT